LYNQIAFNYYASTYKQLTLYYTDMYIHNAHTYFNRNRAKRA